mmetsp:Transcript_1428/g.1642  ORF Transcript_1428/g.1642 Transcript_1428/m.1642 type:complete len:119 (+) Transcript_1428:1396-1752(+)
MGMRFELLQSEIKGVPEDGQKAKERVRENNAFMLGDNRDGICGSEANANFAVEPTVVYKRFLKIACGYHHNAGVDEYGRVYTWGRSEFGQLGQGEVINSSIPTLIALPLRNIRVNEVC